MKLLRYDGLSAKHYKQLKNENNMIKYISGDILQSKDEYIAQGVAIGSNRFLCSCGECAHRFGRQDIHSCRSE